MNDRRAWGLLLALVVGCSSTGNGEKADAAGDQTDAAADANAACLWTFNMPYDLAVELCDSIEGPCKLCVQSVDCQGNGLEWKVTMGDCACGEPYAVDPSDGGLLPCPG